MWRHTTGNQYNFTAQVRDVAVWIKSLRHFACLSLFTLSLGRIGPERLLTARVLYQALASTTLVVIT